jgi:hypothetical protein
MTNAQAPEGSLLNSALDSDARVVNGLTEIKCRGWGKQHVQQIVLEVGVAGEPFMGLAQRERKHQRKTRPPCRELRDKICL